MLATDSNVSAFLETLVSDPDNRKPGSPARLIAADAFQEAGRDREASLLRSGDAIYLLGPVGSSFDRYLSVADLCDRCESQVVRTRPIDLADAFAAYKECALWSSTHYAPEGEEDERDGRPLDVFCTVADIHPGTLRRMNQDVIDFVEDHWEMLPDGEFDQVGSCLWLSRNGHGAGFFDRSEVFGDHTDDLQDAARRMGEFNLEVDEAGTVRGF